MTSAPNMGLQLDRGSRALPAGPAGGPEDGFLREKNAAVFYVIPCTAKCSMIDWMFVHLITKKFVTIS